MNDFSLVSAFLIGLAGGVHCLGMCGGITLAMRSASPVSMSHFPFALSYHLGRIFSYTLAGGLTGLLGSMISTSSHTGALSLKVLSIIMLVLLAMYIGQWYRGLVWLERAGSVLWRRIQPLSKQFMPFKTPMHALPYGMIWGWLPCGLVYSTLTWSLASQSALQGASVMLAFGLGTLPVMLVASTGASTLLGVFKHKFTRHLIAISLMAYAFALLYTILV